MTAEISKKETKALRQERPILAPVDFSPPSRAALAWAADLAARLGAPLLVLHVVHDPEGGPGYYARPKRKGFLRRMEEAAGEIMATFMKQCRKEIPAFKGLANVHEMMVLGLPANRIIEVAEKVDARLIVMGSQGRTGLARMLLGSKAERVVQLAQIPVTIVKAPRAKKDGE